MTDHAPARRASINEATFTATYTPSWNDYLALCEASVLRKPAWRRPRWPHWVLTALVAGIGTWLLISGRTTSDLVFGIFISVGVVLVLILEFALIPLARNRAYTRQDLAKRTVELSVSVAGVDIVQGAARSHIGWAGFDRTDRFRHGTVLWLIGRQPFFVPDRAFASSTEAAECFAYAEEKIAGAEA